MARKEYQRNKCVFSKSKRTLILLFKWRYSVIKLLYLSPPSPRTQSSMRLPYFLIHHSWRPPFPPWPLNPRHNTTNERGKISKKRRKGKRMFVLSYYNNNNCTAEMSSRSFIHSFGILGLDHLYSHYCIPVVGNLLIHLSKAYQSTRPDEEIHFIITINSLRSG